MISYTMGNVQDWEKVRRRGYAFLLASAERMNILQHFYGISLITILLVGLLLVPVLLLLVRNRSLN